MKRFKWSKRNNWIKISEEKLVQCETGVKKNKGTNGLNCPRGNINSVETKGSSFSLDQNKINEQILNRR